jgi:hypothetical protein
VLCHVQLAERVGLKEADIARRGQQLVRHQLHDICKRRAWGKRQLLRRKIRREVLGQGRQKQPCALLGKHGQQAPFRPWLMHMEHAPLRASRREAETQLGQAFPPGAPWVWKLSPPERVPASALVYGGQH